MATDTTKAVPQIVEDLVIGSTTRIRPSSVSALSSLTATPLKGAYLVTATFDIAALTAAVTRQLQEFTITDSSHTIRVAVGDLFIPFNPAIGSSANQLNSTVALLPAVAQTADKLPVVVANLTAAATDPASGTFTFLWIKAA